MKNFYFEVQDSNFVRINVQTCDTFTPITIIS